MSSVPSINSIVPLYMKQKNGQNAYSHDSWGESHSCSVFRIKFNLMLELILSFPNYIQKNVDNFLFFIQGWPRIRWILEWNTREKNTFAWIDWMDCAAIVVFPLSRMYSRSARFTKIEYRMQMWLQYWQPCFMWKETERKDREKNRKKRKTLIAKEVLLQKWTH